MKALVREVYGGPEEISVKDLPITELGRDEVEVRIHYATVSRTDCGILYGLPKLLRLFIGWNKPRRPVLGSDFSGIVSKVGLKVKNFQVGDRVFGFNDEGLSSYATSLKISSKGLICKVPDKTSLVDAVASTEGAHYALCTLKKISLMKNSKVLLLGATGSMVQPHYKSLKPNALPPMSQ